MSRISRIENSAVHFLRKARFISGYLASILKAVILMSELDFILSNSIPAAEANLNKLWIGGACSLRRITRPHEFYILLP